MQFILTGVERRDKVVRALAGAAGATLTKEWNGIDIPLIVGNDLGMGEIQRKRNAENQPYLYIDHAYFNRHPQMERFRLCVSNYHCTDWRDSDRKALTKVRDWKKGSDVVIIMPAHRVWKFYPCEAWRDQMIAILRQHTDRKIIIKEKGKGALLDVLGNAWAAVCFGSVADVDAACFGIPVFSGDRSPVYPIALHDVRQIETPSYPDRGQWLRSLAAAEWSLHEASLAWERVKCLLPHTQNCKPQ